jgi:hypothetical protein
VRALAFTLTAALACAQTSSEIRAIAERAYTFAYPMVLMEYTAPRRSMYWPADDVLAGKWTPPP